MFGKKGKSKKLKLPEEGIKKFRKSKLENLKEINKITSDHNSYGDEFDEKLVVENSDNFTDEINDISIGDYIVNNELETSYEAIDLSKVDSNQELIDINKKEIADDLLDDIDRIEDEEITDIYFDNGEEIAVSDEFAYNNFDDEIDFQIEESIDDKKNVLSNIDTEDNTTNDDGNLYKGLIDENIDEKITSKNKINNKKQFSFKIFDKLMIKTRILLGFMSILLLISIVGIMVFSTIGSMIKSQIPIILHTENFKNKVFEMERVEKNFLLFEPSNLEFYKTGESRYVEEFKVGYSEAVDSFEKVINSRIIKASDNVEEIEAFRIMLEEYNTEFLKVTEMIAVKGYGEYGKMGELKAASEELKKAVEKSNSPELEAELYKVFLLESEYFRTNDEKIFKKIPAASSTFKNLLNKVDISNEEKGEIRSGLTKYNSKIQLVNSLNKSVYNDRFGAITQYREKGNAIIDQINVIYINVSDSALTSLNASRMSISTIIIVSVLLTLFVAVIITTTIVKPINDTKELVKDIAEGEGDLTHTFAINGKNEMEQMKASINIFISKIRDIIIGVKGTSLTLSESSNELSKAVEEANIHIEEISTEVSKISTDLLSTSDYVIEVNSAITDMTTSASSITNEAIMVSSNSLEIIEAANRGSDLINVAASSIDDVKQSSESVNGAISELQVHSKEIGGIIDIIKGISDQTNLLALNASIEAARAGEHGRGFAVVANEVRNLSEETKKSTAKISDLIKKIEIVVNKANSNIKKEQEKVNVSVKQTYEAKNEFAIILDMIKELSNKIEYIVSQSDKQNNITSEMALSITDILNKTEKNTESSAKISENIESQVSIFEEIGASLQELSAMADVLTSETNKFKV